MIFSETKTILIYCEESGMFANIYRQAGYHVVVRDLKRNKNHDIRLQEMIPEDIYGLLCFPPCTHLAGSGARWWKKKGNSALLEALSVADACMRIVALKRNTLRFWMLENPVGRLSRYYGPPKMTINPSEYALWADNPDMEAYTKRTCLWGDFRMPTKKPVAPALGSIMHKLPPSENRAELRSKTPQGFARAFFHYNQ